MKGSSKGKKGERSVFTGPFVDKGKMKGMKGDKGFKGMEKGFEKGGKGKGKQADLVVSGCSNEMVGTIIRGDYAKYGANHGRPAYRKMDKGPTGQDVQIYFWDNRDGPSMCGWWFGAAVGGDMVWSFNPGDASPVPPRSGWKVPFEGDVDPNLVVTLSNGAAVEVGAETHIRVQGCSHPIVSPIVNGSFVRSSENHGKPVYKKTVQTKDKVDVLIYFWDDVQNPTFCGWWFGPEVGAEQVWAYNSSRLGTAPLGGWKVPYDGPVDPKLHISVDRLAASRQHAEATRASRLIRQVLLKLPHVKPEDLEKVEEELKGVLEKELEACGTEQAKMQEECDRALEQAKARVAELREAQEKAGPLMQELESLLAVAESCVESLGDTVDAAGLEKAEDAVKACSQYIIETGEPLTFAEGHLERMQRLHACKKALRRGHGQKRHQESLAKMACYDGNKDGLLEKKDLKKYAQSEHKFLLPDAAVEKIFRLLVPVGSKGVRSEDFQRLKVQVGIAREQKLDLERKKKREEHERELELIKERLQTSLEEELVPALGEVVEAGEKLQEDAEKLKAMELQSAELLAQLDDLEKSCTACREQIGLQLQKLKELKEEEKEVLYWLQGQLRPHEQKLKGLEVTCAKISQSVIRQRKDTEKKQQGELEELQRQALELIRHYQKAKELLNVDVFPEMSSDGEVDSKSFLAFFARCGEEANGELEMLSEEDLLRLLSFWSAGSVLDAERVGDLLRGFMKVRASVAMTKEASPASGAVRKLQVGEVLALLGAPFRDEKVEVTRVKVQAMNDGTEGFVSLAGNQGTTYLEEGGGIFKVVKETLLTSDFEIGAASKEIDRRLHVGELVELKSAMQKHPKSGLKRVRCRATSDGVIGWATVVGNQGTVYLEVK